MKNETIKWKILSSATALIAAAAVQAILTKGWKVIKHEDPPEHPESIDTSWTEAISWTIATALTAGLAKLLAQRYAVSSWKKVTGHNPPV